MPRRIFEASLFHLSPFDIEWLLREDRFHMSSACASYKGGILMLCDAPICGVANRLSLGTRPVIGYAPSDITHLFFHKEAAVLPLPVNDQELVSSAYQTPPFSKLWDDSIFASTGYEKLWEDPEFDGTSEYFEKMVRNSADAFLHTPVTFEHRFDLEDMVERAYNLACGIEHVKLDSNQSWSKCDEALNVLSVAIDHVIEALGPLYSVVLNRLDNNVLATKTRVCRSLRVTDEWRRQLV